MAGKAVAPWVCTTCGRTFTDCEQGILIAEDNLTGWRVVHHISCDPDCGPWHSLAAFVGARGARVFEGMRKQGAFSRLSAGQLADLRAAVVRTDYDVSRVTRCRFRDWMRRQVGRDDAIGDLARDLSRDRYQQAPNPSLRDLYGWLRASGASAGTLETLLEAYREWQSVGNTYRASAGGLKRVGHKVRLPNRKQGELAKRFRILKRDGYRCQLCGRTAQDGVTLEIDHKHPRAKGGTDDEANLWTLCWDCNRGNRDTLL